MIKELFKKYAKYIYIGIGALILIITLVLIGQWRSWESANKLADKLRQEFQIENRAFYDNLAVLRDKTQQIENQYDIQRNELNAFRRNQRGGTENAFKNPDKNVAARYFDNVIDAYIPNK